MLGIMVISTHNYIYYNYCILNNVHELLYMSKFLFYLLSELESVLCYNSF
jgi:hypothetical protein